MFPDNVKDWLNITAIILSIGAVIHSWLTSQAKDNETHLKAVDVQIKEQDRRIQNIETEIKHLPSKEDVHDLKVAVAELSGRFGGVDENLSVVKRSINRIEDLLLNPKG